VVVTSEQAVKGTNSPALSVLPIPGSCASVAVASPGTIWMVTQRGTSMETGIRSSEPGISSPCITATGLEVGQGIRQNLNAFGASFREEWSSDITILIAHAFRRTTKLMCAICQGAEILKPAYLSASRAAGRLLDPGPFALQDKASEDAFAKKKGLSGGYSLKLAISRARLHGPLLAGVSVFCFCSVSGRAELQTLVHAAGGMWLECDPRGCSAASGPENTKSLGGAGGATVPTILIVGEESSESTGLEAARFENCPVYDAELLREAACTQELRHEIYRIS